MTAGVVQFSALLIVEPECRYRENCSGAQTNQWNYRARVVTRHELRVSVREHTAIDVGNRVAETLAVT